MKDKVCRCDRCADLATTECKTLGQVLRLCSTCVLRWRDEIRARLAA